MATGREMVKVSSEFFRPTEVELLLGDPTKAKSKLNWKPRVSFEELVAMMVKSDIQAAGLNLD